MPCFNGTKDVYRDLHGLILSTSITWETLLTGVPLLYTRLQNVHFAWTNLWCAAVICWWSVSDFIL